MVSFPPIAACFSQVIAVAATSLACIGCFGNGLILWALLSSKRRGGHEVTNLIICAQAAVDLLSGLLTSCFGIISISLHHFPGAAFPSSEVHFFSETTIWRSPLCTFNGYCLHFVSFISIYTVVLIAWERYCSVSRPLRRRRLTQRCLLKCLFVIWTSGAIFAAVPIWKSEYVLHEPGAFCYGLIGPNVTSTITCVAILTSSACTCALYSRMYLHVLEAFRGRSINQEFEISKQFFTIIACFTGCWLPAGIDFFLGMIGVTIIKKNTFIHFARPIFFLLCTGNSAITPLLYIFMNKKVKHIVYQHVLHKFSVRKQWQVLVIRSGRQGPVSSRKKRSRCFGLKTQVECYTMR